MTWIYLHGFASGPQSTKARFFRERLAGEGVDLLVPDLTSGDFEHLTITGQLAVLAQTAGEPSVLIGSSMGGYLAALYAARHVEVTKLVLMAPAFGFTQRWPEALGPHQLARWKTSGFLDVYHYGEERQQRLHYGLMEDAARYEPAPDFRQPALIFHGQGDETVPVSRSQEFAASHPNALLHVLDSGHELLNVLELMWAESRDFLLS